MYLSKTEARLDVGHVHENEKFWVTDVSIVDVNVQLHFDVTKGDQCFAGHGHNLIHDDVCWLFYCRTIPAQTIVLSK
jgi:hypothetical protein